MTDCCHTFDMETSIRTYIYVTLIGLPMSNREIQPLRLAQVNKKIIFNQEIVTISKKNRAIQQVNYLIQLEILC